MPSSIAEREKRYPSHFKTQPEQELIRLALHKSPFFACLDEEQIDRFVAVAERKGFSPGEIVILEGCVDQQENEEAEGDSSEEKESPEEPVSQTPSSESHKDLGTEDAFNHANDDSIGNVLHDTPPVAISSDQAEVIPVQQEEETPDSTEESKEGANVESQVASSDAHSGDSVKPEKPKDTLIQRVSTVMPPPANSGVKRSIYIVGKGTADVWYQPQNFRPASLGPGALFGEGGFLFGRQHSASVLAARANDTTPNQNTGLECWVVDFTIFREFVLPSDNMRRLFLESASKKDENGVAYMSMEEFVEQRIKQESTINAATQRTTVLEDPMATLRIVSSFHKNTKWNEADEDERIYLEDYCFFHLLMDRPDPEVDIAFLLMDQRQTGQIFLKDLAKFVEPLFPDLDTTSQLFQRYFGKDGNQSIRQVHFSQFLVDLQREMGKQAFLRAIGEEREKGRAQGYLDPDEFIHVLTTACGWRLPQGITDRLRHIYNREAQQSTTTADLSSNGEGSPMISSSDSNSNPQYFAYGDFIAFQEVLGNLPGICNLIDRAEEIKKGPISADDFKVANSAMGLGGRLSRRQVEIVFILFDQDRDGYISREDTLNVCGMNFVQRLVAQPGRGGRLTFTPAPSDYFYQQHRRDLEAKLNAEDVQSMRWKRIAEFAQYFWVSALASSLGVVFLYPIDLAKTRLMNEQIRIGKTAMYNGWTDCVQQVFRLEGPLGLYRGITPQLLGVAPEKLIKLQVNDLLRQVLGAQHDQNALQEGSNHSTHRLGLHLEFLAGACAGACQLLITTPMELAKIRMQLHGETARLLESRGATAPPVQSFRGLVRDLGFPGVYRGASACLLRDVPFSAIYFPAYAACKEFLLDQQEGGDRKATSLTLLGAGTLAGIPAALATSPADLIKTRLQAAQRAGEMQYAGIRDCAAKIYKHEGWQTFFRGSTVRVLRIAPQFGISLLAYEHLSQWVGNRPDHESESRYPPTNAPIHPRDYSNAFLPPPKKS